MTTRRIHGSMETLLEEENFAKAGTETPAFRMSGVVGLPRPTQAAVSSLGRGGREPLASIIWA